MSMFELHSFRIHHSVFIIVLGTTWNAWDEKKKDREKKEDIEGAKKTGDQARTQATSVWASSY